MSLSVSKTELFSSGSISFSSLRSSFRENSSGSISASELRRNTSLSETDPVVPDATENSSISTTDNLKLSQFRNSIKYYNINQSGTDLNLDLSSATWNNNLGKNIVKNININGTCGSTNGTPAASLDVTSLYNVLLNISGSILGTGGDAGIENGSNSTAGTDGGDALYINTNNTGTVTIKTIGASAQVYGGGGGGGAGGDGGNGGGGFYNTTYDCSYWSCGGGSGFHNAGSWDGACRAQNNNNSCYCQTPNYGFSGPTWACCSCCCYNSRTCGSTGYTSGGSGGDGADGGIGQGYLQNKTLGGIGTNGLSGGANAGAGGNGGNGGDGGTWGQDGEDGDNGDTGNNGNNGVGIAGLNGTSGGTAGRAVAGSGYTFDATGVESAYLGLK